MKRLLCLVFIPGILLLPACRKDKMENLNEPVTINLPAKGDEIIKYSNNFGVELFKSLAISQDRNLMISPLSASIVLSMLLNGTSGETYSQIRDMLGMEGLSVEEINNTFRSLGEQLTKVDTKVHVSLANALWYRNSFEVLKPYTDTLRNSYSAYIEGLDFSNPSALSTINGWASSNTNGKIEEVLDEISPETVLFLMNALYFKGEWTYYFDKSYTSQEAFFADVNLTLNVSTMNGRIPAKTYHSAKLSAVELTYGHSNFSMVIILPFESMNDFIGDFNPAIWNNLTYALDNDSFENDLEISIPKFRFTSEKVLNDNLKALGMTNAFDPVLADLSGISNTPTFVNFVKQNSFIDVNEEGTEAAAISTIGVDLTSIETFKVNKPFIFCIRERTTNALLFIGKVALPEY